MLSSHIEATIKQALLDYIKKLNEIQIKSFKRKFGNKIFKMISYYSNQRKQKKNFSDLFDDYNDYEQFVMFLYGYDNNAVKGEQKVLEISINLCQRTKSLEYLWSFKTLCDIYSYVKTFEENEKNLSSVKLDHQKKDYKSDIMNNFLKLRNLAAHSIKISENNASFSEIKHVVKSFLEEDAREILKNELEVYNKLVKFFQNLLQNN